jgi:hypothetical protein
MQVIYFIKNNHRSPCKWQKKAIHATDPAAAVNKKEPIAKSFVQPACHYISSIISYFCKQYSCKKLREMGRIGSFAVASSCRKILQFQPSEETCRSLYGSARQAARRHVLKTLINPTGWNELSQIHLSSGITGTVYAYLLWEFYNRQI